MTIIKENQGPGNMLFILASLACNGQNDGSTNSVVSMERQRVPLVAAVSDISDDDTTTSPLPSTKDLVVARRRRRPLKKRQPMDICQSPLLFLDSSINRRKSLLETSIEIVYNSSLKRKRKVPNRVVESRDEPPAAVPKPSTNLPNNERCSSSSSPVTVDEEMPTLVSVDEAWKNVHSPLDLPSFLPCPAMALKHVKSINLTIEDR